MRLLLLPGLDGTGRLFEPLLRALPLELSPVLVPQIMSLLLRRSAFVIEPPQFAVNRYLLGERPPIDLVEAFRHANSSVRPDVLASRMRSVMDVDARRAFAACRLPILYLRARQDRVVKIRSLVQMQKLQPEMTIAEIDGPHLLLQREPEKCAIAIAQYLKCRNE